MKAVDIKGGKGHADALFINDQTPKPTAQSGEAIVAVRAFGLNRMDLLQREGNYPLPPQASKTLGVEFSGTIESLGDGNHGDLKVGDAVFGLAYGGAYAEFLAVPSAMLLSKPDWLDWAHAASIPETWITATQALHFVGDFARGQKALWHAGSSGVGIAGIQLSRRAGAADVFATAGAKTKCDFIVGELGATAAFNYKTEDWSDGVLQKTGGKGVDLIVDFIGASYFAKNLAAAGMDAHIVCLGMMGGAKVSELDISPILRKRIRVEGSTLRSRSPEYQHKLLLKLNEYIPDFKSGELKLFVDKILPWEKIREAHEYMEGNTSMGKIVCTIA